MVKVCIIEERIDLKTIHEVNSVRSEDHEEEGNGNVSQVSRGGGWIGGGVEKQKKGREPEGHLGDLQQAVAQWV